jgi:hypothetical protein
VTVEQHAGEAMINKLFSGVLALTGTLAVAAIFVPARCDVAAQEEPKPKPKIETIQAQAMGQLTATGKTFNVTVRIESYSTPEDQKILIDAFTSGGHNALVKALSKMKPRGRVAITGTIGYQVAYVRSFPTETGRRIRLITDRPIKFREAYNSGRSTDYDLSALEINIDNDPKKSDGSLIVAGKFLVDKKTQQITFESYGSGPWRLVNVMERD